MLTEEIIAAFEKADSDTEAALGLLHRIRGMIVADQTARHKEFREKYGITDSAFQGIADWRWRQKHP